MTMYDSAPHSGIDALVADLVPVRRVRPAAAIAGVAAVVIVAVGVIALQFGLRADVMAARPHPMIMIREGMLLLLGGATLGAVIQSARPGVGRHNGGWLWVLAAAMLFPLTAIVLSMINGRFPMPDAMSPSAPYCMGISLTSGLIIGGVLTAWLRSGAPTVPARTGWLVGLSSGSFGAFAYGLHCPSDSVYYVGLWYSIAIGACAVLGRLIVPRLIRW
jgi:hypothetical protein